MAFIDNVSDWFESLADRFRRENDELRREDRENELINETNEIANDATDASQPAKILSVDFKAKENAANHHCEKYELLERRKDVSVLRRGGTFLITVTFNKTVDLKKQHQLKIYMSFGPRPNTQNGTQAVMTVSGKMMFDKNHEIWDVRVDEKTPTSATLEIQIPTEAPVGLWSTAFELADRGDKDGASRHLMRSEQMTYILFNPWNKRDYTYMAEEPKREEYILNDVGKVWIGSYPTARGRHWVFGQFDDAVLPACILLMEKAKVSPENRGDPIRVARAISRIVNSNDDNGVIMGRWDGNYEDGSPPTKWTGSIAILEQYVSTQKPVRYGQCWVFAAVVNTVCRAIGLPARVVTNLNSAHDTNGSLTIDEYFDKDGEEYRYNFTGPNPEGERDSIWNFHVWNDVWMARPDLPDGYGGWQVIDATPQETSDGVYQCGPASHEAIRQGQMHFKYDVPFVLAEVNADVVHWQVDDGAPDGFKKLSSNQFHVGKQVLTKAIGDVESGGFNKNDREDITQEYKPNEGSRAERLTLYTAARRSRAARHAFRLPSEAIEDVEFNIKDVERVPIGEDFSITVTMKNVGDANRTVTMKNVGDANRTVTSLLTASSTYYTGAKAYPITRAEGEFVLKPNETKTLSLPVKYKDYFPLLVEHAMIKLVAICNVKETSFSWVGEDKFQVIKPDMIIELTTEAVVDQPLGVRFSFSNPLSNSLTKCSLVVDAPGLVRPKTIPLSNVPSKAKMVHEMKLYPKKETNCTIVATFNSIELRDLTGCVNVTILSTEG
uniref:protein-glutamine gamma-glutamyltransferase n=1 Tax=Macrobrachium rosenbergii TaxID=79674 RepID=A0A024GWU1_MACRS|nr:transglutaminase [Macrobrachium rosenbergii]